MVTPEDYAKILHNVELFLSGKQSELVEKIKEQMEYHANCEEFELAARYRDSYFDIQKTMERQKIVSENTKLFQDIIGVAQDGGHCAVVILKIRQGRLIATSQFEVSIQSEEEKNEIILSFLKEYYSLCSTSEIPKEILTEIQLETEDKELYETWLSEKSEHKVKFLSANTKKNTELINLANTEN